MKATLRFKSFPGHKGIPGHQGGSLPENAGGSSEGDYLDSLASGMIADRHPERAGQKPVTTSDLRENVTTDAIKRGVPAFLTKYDYRLESYANEPDVFTFARGYYYRSNMRGEMFNAGIETDLDRAGYGIKMLASGDHYVNEFVGGAPTLSSKSSFMYLVAKIYRK